MTCLAPRIVLASASPRRRALLREAGVAFEVVSVHLDEGALVGADAGGTALLRARAKARAVARGLTSPAGPVLVLGADTVVALDDGTLLDKPLDGAEAERHLRALSGTTHRVLTAVCLVDLPSGVEEEFVEETRVTMRTLAEGEIAAYVASGEGLDKAGGYAIQEGGDGFVVALVGSRTNVVGLPMEATLERLGRRGCIR